MKTADPERTAQACRFYGALLQAYPASFRRDYDDILVQHFRDEYRHALVSRKRFRLLRLWVFILFDFLRSLLREYQEEVSTMVKKYFFVFCAIAAGIFTPMMFFFMGAKYDYYIDHVLIIPFWFQILTQALFVGFGALALFGIAKATDSHFIFQLLSILVLISAAVLLPTPIFGGRGTGTVMSELHLNEDHVAPYIFLGYFVLIGIIAIVALLKRKWLPGVTLLMVFLPIPIMIVGNLLQFDFLFLVYGQPNWYSTLYIIFTGIAWFVIAWWLSRENKVASLPSVLEAA
jgi:hypothetical protein